MLAETQAVEHEHIQAAQALHSFRRNFVQIGRVGEIVEAVCYDRQPTVKNFKLRDLMQDDEAYVNLESYRGKKYVLLVFISYNCDMTWRYEKRIGPGEAQFDTFVVEMNELGADGQRSISRWWLSPLEKYVIRFDSSDSNGRANRAVVTTIKR